MNKEKLRDLVFARPFKPFNIHLAEGTIIPVRHPEFVLLTQAGRTAYVHTGRGDEVKIVDVLLITHLSKNGAAPKRRRTGRRKS